MFIFMSIRTTRVLDGMSNVRILVDKAVKSGMHAVALTDHGKCWCEGCRLTPEKKNGKYKDIMRASKRATAKEGISDEEKTSLEAEIPMQNRTSLSPFWVVRPM